MNRATLTGAIGVAGLLVATVGPFGFGNRDSHPAQLIAWLGGYVLVLAQARSSLPWCSALPAGRVIRRFVRVAVYLVPIISVGFPMSNVSVTALLASIGIGLVGVVAEWREIRIGLSSRYLRLLPPVDRVGRKLNLLFYCSAGAAQEYLYRGLLISGLRTWPVVAIVLSTIAFVVEHMAQAGPPGQWDKRDVFLHAALSVGFGTVVVIWGSLPAVMIGHTVYNSPNILQALARPGVTSRKEAIT